MINFASWVARFTNRVHRRAHEERGAELFTKVARDPRRKSLVLVVVSSLVIDAHFPSSPARRERILGKSAPIFDSLRLARLANNVYDSGVPESFTTARSTRTNNAKPKRHGKLFIKPSSPVEFQIAKDLASYCKRRS